ncbi:hypothetical protein [Salana multivorans]
MTTSPDPSDELPEGFTVPDDLSSLFPDEPAGTVGSGTAGPESAANDDVGDAPADDVPAASSGASPTEAASAGASEEESESEPVPIVRTTAVVLTRVRQAKVLAGLMALAGIDAAVVPSQRGAIAVRYVEQEAADVDPAEALSGIPVEAEALGAALSVATRAETVLLAGRVNEIEGEITGQVRARTYRGGQIVGEPPPGLVLASADLVAERLLIGVVQAPEVSGYISSTDLGGGQARPGRFLFGRRRREDGPA